VPAELPAGILIRSSPARRARATARAIAGRGRSVVLDADLLETDVGEVEGLTWDELAARHPELATAVLGGGAIDWPGGERSIELEDRASRAARRIVVAATERPVLVVSHGGLIHVLRAALEAGGLAAADAAAAAPGPLPAGGVLRLVPGSRT